MYNLLLASYLLVQQYHAAALHKLLWANVLGQFLFQSAQYLCILSGCGAVDWCNDLPLK